MSNRPNTRGAGSSPAARAAQSGTGSSAGLWIGIGVAVVVLIAVVVAVAVTRGGDDTTTTASSASLIDPAEAQPVRVEGVYLPMLPESGPDPAVGKPMPVLTGSGLDGQSVTVGAHDGTPKLIVYMAHWCPHCNRELPKLVDWWSEGLPEGVEVQAVTTAIDKAKPNYPPTEWLADAGWPVPTLLDPTGAAAEASGVSGFPFFVLTDGAGNVVERRSGEQPVDSLQQAVADLASAPAAS